MSDDSMSPDDLMRAYMGPSATSGPEAAPRCLICGTQLKGYEIGPTSTCMGCELACKARNESEAASRAVKMREAYFAGLNANSPELQRELSGAKSQNVTMAQQLYATQRELKETRLDLEADAQRRKWEAELAGFGIAPVAPRNRAQLFWAIGVGAVIGVLVTRAWYKRRP